MPSAATIRDRGDLLKRLHHAGLQEVNQLWRAASSLSSPEFRALIIEAFPEIAGQYNQAAADLAADWYDDAAPNLTYRATPAEAPAAVQFEESAKWALASYGDKGLQRLGGVLQRAVFDGARATIVENVRMEPGARWARHASANACAFCVMMATRGAVYSSKGAAQFVGADRWEQYRRTGGRKVAGVEMRRAGRVRGTQKPGDKYHDDCHCMAVEVRPGQSYEPPPYVEKWNDAYEKASQASKGGDYGAISTKDTLSKMREILGTH